MSYTAKVRAFGRLVANWVLVGTPSGGDYAQNKYRLLNPDQENQPSSMTTEPTCRHVLLRPGLSGFQPRYYSMRFRAQGYTGCISTLRSYIRTMKPAPRPDPIVRFETDPGQQMQVDWGVFRLNGKRVSLFLSTLGWSRYAYGLFVDNERFDTLRRCHEQAFDEFGGVPLEILYDNMKTVVTNRNAYGDGLHQFHAGLQDLAHHYGFLPRLCRPYRAKTKGKVERQIGYIRRSFFVPLLTRYRQSAETLDLDTLNLEFARWMALVANARLHGTTGEVPEQRLNEERLALLPLPPSDIKGSTLTNTTTLEPTQPFEDKPLQHELAVYDALLESA